MENHIQNHLVPVINQEKKNSTTNKKIFFSFIEMERNKTLKAVEHKTCEITDDFLLYRPQSNLLQIRS